MLRVCKAIHGHLFRNLPRNRCSEKKRGKSSAGPSVQGIFGNQKEEEVKVTGAVHTLVFLCKE